MFGLFGSGKKDWQANINSGEHKFTVKAGDNLLNAALGLGIPWHMTVVWGAAHPASAY